MATISKDEESASGRTPSMDDKATPSPPVRTTAQYDADCKAGIQRTGKPKDRKDAI